MLEHDAQVGELLKLLDDLKIADNTIVIYTTDNGANQGPVAGWRRRRRSVHEKDTNWEGAYRVPALIRWTGKIKAGSNFTELFSAEDWLPTLVAAAGGSQTVREDSVKGVTLGSKTFKVHIDGYNQLPYLTGADDEERAPGVRVLQRRRRSGRLPQRWLRGGASARRYATGMQVWRQPLTSLRAHAAHRPEVGSVRGTRLTRLGVLGEVRDGTHVSDPADRRQRRPVHWRPTRHSRRARNQRVSQLIK